MTELEQLITESRIIVCCGTGGVGKTTTSAALALKAARMGKRALVVTIDPAKRLATSLGMEEIPDEPLDLTSHLPEKVKGRFSAVVPNSERTFERLVRTLARGDDSAMGRVFKTSIYKIFTKEFSGAHEYMAMEKLHELSQLLDKGELDLIVLDTPPSANTTLFLEAPHRMASFFDETVMRWFTAPAGKWLAGGVEKALGMLEKLTGHGFLTDLMEFARALFALRAQFVENLAHISNLLRRADTRFVMVTTSERLARPDTQGFVQGLHRDGYSFWGFLVNRVLASRLGLKRGALQENPAWAQELQGTVDEKTVAALRSGFRGLQPRLEQETDAELFLQGLDPRFHVAEIPEQDNDVHSIEALHALSQSY